MPRSTLNRSPQTPFSTILPSFPEPSHGSISLPKRPPVTRLLLRSVAGRITTLGNAAMPHSSDDPSSDRISAEAPSAQPPEGPESEPPSPSHPATPADDASIASDPQDRTADHRDAPRLPRRRRRRRRPPRAADPPGATLALRRRWRVERLKPQRARRSLLQMSPRRTMSRLRRTDRTNSHAAGATDGAPRARGKRTQPRQAKPALVSEALGRERRDTNPHHTAAREAAGRPAAEAAMNGRRRGDLWAMAGALQTTVHAARARQGATMDDR